MVLYQKCPLAFCLYLAGDGRTSPGFGKYNFEFLGDDDPLCEVDSPNLIHLKNREWKIFSSNGSGGQKLLAAAFFSALTFLHTSLALTSTIAHLTSLHWHVSLAYTSINSAH